MLNCRIYAGKNEFVMSFWIHLCFHVNAVSVNYHKVTSGWINLHCNLLCHNKNTNKYDEHIEIKIYPVIKVRKDYKEACLMAEYVEELTDSRSAKDEDGQ